MNTACQMPQDDDEPDCNHEDYDLDILSGRASCNMCPHHWYMSNEELKRDEELRAAPYPPDAATEQRG